MLRYPVRAIISCSSTPLWKRRVAVVTRSEWFVLNPVTPPAWHTLATVLARVLCPICTTRHPLVSLEVSGTVQIPQLLADVPGTSCIGELGTPVGFRHWHDGPLALVAPSCVKFHLHCLFFLNSLCIWGRVRHQKGQLTQSVWLENFYVLATSKSKVHATQKEQCVDDQCVWGELSPSRPCSNKLFSSSTVSGSACFWSTPMPSEHSLFISLSSVLWNPANCGWLIMLSCSLYSLIYHSRQSRVCWVGKAAPSGLLL